VWCVDHLNKNYMKNFFKIQTFEVRHDGSCLESQLLGRWRLGGFEASLGEKLMKTHLNKQATHGGTHL
jgi:hypothetical protein